MATYKGHNEDSSGNILLSIGNGMTATVETGSTASQAYTKGAYLFFNNRFCKATAAISSGATLAIGTNLSETSVGAEITSHLRSSDGKEFYFDVKDGTYGYYPSASKTASEFVPFGGTEYSSLASYIIGPSGSLSLTVPKGSLVVVLALVGGGPYSFNSEWTVTNLDLLVSGPVSTSSNYPFGGILKATNTNITIVSKTGASTNVFVATP